MNIGKLNREVTIKSLAVGQDAIGQPTQTWATLATVWANIRFGTGAEAIKADVGASIAKASIRIRNRADVTAAMRVYEGATVYEIKAVLLDPQDRDRLDLVCEVVSG